MKYWITVIDFTDNPDCPLAKRDDTTPVLIRRRTVADFEVVPQTQLTADEMALGMHKERDRF